MQRYLTFIFIVAQMFVSAIDMAEPLVTEQLELEQNGIEAYDAMLKLNVLVVAPVICILADNPRASELLNHLGPSSRRYCRMYMVSILREYTLI